MIAKGHVLTLCTAAISLLLLVAAQAPQQCGTVCSTPLDCQPPCSYCAGLVPSSSWSGSQDDGTCQSSGPSPPSGGCNEYCSGNDDCNSPSCPYCNMYAASASNGGICQPWPPSCGQLCSSNADCHKDCLLCSGTANQQGYCYSNTSKCFGPCKTNADCSGDEGQCSSCDNTTKTCLVASTCGQYCTYDADCQKPGYATECTVCYTPNDSNYAYCMPANQTVAPGCHQPCKSSKDCSSSSSICTFCYGGICHQPPKCGQQCYSASDCSPYGYCEACSYNASSNPVGKCYNPWHNADGGEDDESVVRP